MNPRNLASMFIAAAACQAIAAPSFTPSEPSDAVAPWKAVATSGPVDARPYGSAEATWRKLARGERLPSLSDVRTGRRGRATLTDQASVLMIDPASEVRLPEPGGPPRVIQPKGSVVYEVDGSKVRGFEVVTPFLVAGVKGTIFLVTVEERLAAVSVERGVVEVHAEGSDEIVAIRAGETAVFDADGAAEIEVIRSSEKERAQILEHSPRAVAIAERAEEKLDDRVATTDDTEKTLDADGGPLSSTSDTLVDTTESLIDAGVDLISDPIGTIDDPVKDALDPILDPAAGSTGGVLDPLKGLVEEVPLPPVRP